MTVLNENGLETEINDDLVRQIKKDGQWHRFTELPFTRYGTGPKNRACMLIGNNGIGDDVHAMPAFASLVDRGIDVDVFGRSFTGDCFRSVGAKFYDRNEADAHFVRESLSVYGSVHHLSQWCIRHEQETDGNPTLTRFEQIARYVDADLPDRFSWRESFGLPEVRRPQSRIVLSLAATSPHRTYHRSADLYRTLRVTEKRRGIGFIALGSLPIEHKSASFREMLSIIDSALLVVAVDSGPLQIALALGVPAIVLAGGSREDIIVDQFNRYLPVDATILRPSHNYGCDLPCSYSRARGFGVRHRCARFARCVDDIHPSQIIETIRSRVTHIGCE